MKQKIKSAPKELVRRGLDDGTERLRGQLRDTTQRGQTDDYGGDRIEDTAVSGVRRTERGIESLLKQRKKGKARVPDGDPLPPADPPAAQESPADPSPQEPPRIKTREAVAARESGTASSAGGRTEPTPAAGSERQRIKIRESIVRDAHTDTSLTPRDEMQSPRIRTRESAVHDSSVRGGSAPQAGPERPRIRTRETAVRDLRTDAGASPQTVPEVPRIKTRESVAYDPSVDGDSAPQARSDRPQIRTKETAARDLRSNMGAEPQAVPEPPQIKTRDAAAGIPDHIAATAPASGERPPDRLQIKTKDAYIQQRPTASPEQPTQAFVQGQQGFMREQGRRAAVKQAEARRAGNGVVPQVKVGEDVATSVPAQRGYTSGGHRYQPAHSTHQLVSLGNPDAQPVRDGGKATIKTARSAKKASERTAHHTIKTAERSSRRAIKTTQRTAKTTAQTIKTVQKTAQATTKAAQRAVQAARTTAKAAATTAKATAKATVAAVKAAIAAIQALAAAIAAGGWVAVVIILILCLVGLLIASPFGVFLDGGNSPGTDSTSAVMTQINQEYVDTLSSLQAGGSYDSVEIIGRPPSWTDVFAVFAVKTVTGDGVDVVVLDEDRVDRLRTVFWDMTKITTETRTVEHPATDDEDAWTETVLVITVTPRTPDDMRVFYAFTEEQNAALDMLLATDSHTLWSSLLYGSSDEIVAVALSQVGNVGGQPYWSWYGFSSRVEWCACFVSWCANECGYIDAGIIPKFSGCSAGASWFKSRGQWQDNTYEPHPGDIIFFDWDNKGSSGPQNNVPDHVGIVERVENGVVYTVEGNSGDSCRQRHYNIGHYEIWGYATPAF